ncbi:MAG TPA: tRNA epoxyqueuosine(34) reductase QueG [Rhodobiaceae bacterium]|nr:tRNA epoxyqueuosine(34) reductase QueG [Rhodobiaceae bacterium]
MSPACDRHPITPIWIFKVAAAAQLKEKICDAAAAQGFDTCHIASAKPDPSAAQGLQSFIAAGHHGQMDWMESRMDERAAPQKLWPEAQSVIMLGVNYGPDCDPLAVLKDDDKGAISVYAQRRDYHGVIKKKLKALARWLVEETQAEVKVFVDTAPVMEKPLAMRAGLGWQGKHTNLVSREFGSWLFLGSVFTTLKLLPDAPEQDHCGACTACLDICPTRALPAPYKIDARRCISYLTIEHDGMIDRDLRRLMGNHIYGCDDCLAVCPWNKFAQSSEEIKLVMKADYDRPDLVKLSQLDDAAFRRFFAGTPVKRSGRDNFVRNVLIALGNMTQPGAEHIEAVEARLVDGSDVVRASAVWALAQMDITAGKALAEKMRDDESVLVRQEMAALASA